MSYMQPTMDGYDVSHWNQTTLPEPDIDAVLPDYPLTSGKATEGKGFVDPLYPFYMELFRKNNSRYRTAYHWIRSDAAVVQQVDNYWRALSSEGLVSGDGAQVGFFPQLDWERTAGIPDLPLWMVDQWVEAITGRVGRDRLIVYGSDWVPGFIEWRAENPDIAVWYANYNTGDQPSGGWAESRKYNAAFWQFTDHYPVPGFKAPVDGNMILRRDVADRLAGYTPVATEAVATPLPIIINTPHSTQSRKQDDIMGTTQLLIRAKGYNEAFLIPGDYHVSGAMLRALGTAGVPYVDGDEDVSAVSAIAARAGVSMTPSATGN